MTPSQLKEALASSIDPITRDYVQATADEALARGATQLAIDRADIEALRAELRDKLAIIDGRLAAAGIA